MSKIAKYRRSFKFSHKDQLEPKELNEALDNLDTEALLKSQVRQVKWLYNNSNKLTLVYDEKFVRLIVQKLEKKISDLQAKVKLHFV